MAIDNTKNSDEMFYRGHRDRLRKKFLDEKITDDELLELVLAYAIPRRDVRPLARRLMARFENVFKIFSAPIDDLKTVKGIGDNTAIFIKAVQAIMANSYKGCLQDAPVYRDIGRLLDYCRNMLMGKSVEEFHVLYFDTKMHLLADDMHARGTITYAEIYKREILKRALNLNAISVALVHNHPLQDSDFSSDDISATSELIMLLEIAGIKFYDHFLVGPNGNVRSARNEMLI